MIEIHPTKNLQPFSLNVPSSKSYSNRALIIAALAKGTSTLKNVLLCDDTLITIHALKNLGIPIKQQGKNLLIQGREGAFKKPKKALHLGNSGTAVRFLTAVLAINGIPSIITGDKRMQSRPIQDLVDALNQLGGEVQCTHGCPPIKISHKKFPKKLAEKLKGGHAKIRGDISSQFLSALLIATPYAQKKTTISITTPLTSASYIDTTLDAIHHFGIKIKNGSGLYKTFFIKPNQKYRTCTYTVPADASSASYFLALAALHGTKVTLKDIHFSFQGDFQFLEILKKMGCHYTTSKNTITLKCPKKLKTLGYADLNNMPDAALTVAMVCAFAEGRSSLKGLHNLKYKESDRLKALECELKKIGVAAKSTKDGIVINGNPKKMHGAKIETYNDHRIAMCFAIMGTKIPKIFIRNPMCVAKTYPNFWKDLQKVGIQLTTHT